MAGEVLTRLIVTAAPTDTIQLDASQLTIDGASTPLGKKLRFTSDTGRITIRLAKRAQVGDTVSFLLRYHGEPERGLYFVPRRRVMWTQGEATETHSWVPTYDAPNDKTTWEILVTADTGVSVLSNGQLVGVTPASNGIQQVWHWAQELPASTYLYSIVAGHFAVLRDNWRGVPVNYWAATDTVDAARDARRFIALNDPSPEQRQEAIRQLGRYDADNGHDLIVAALGDPDGLVRGRAIRSFARRDTAAAQAEAVRLIPTDPSFYVQTQGLSVYDPSRAPEGTALLISRIRNGGSHEVRTTAAERLHLKPDAAGLDALESMTDVSEPRNVRETALGLLADWPETSRAVAVAMRHLGDGDPLFASDAVRTLARIGGERAKATLTAALATESRVTVKAAMRRALTPRQ